MYKRSKIITKNTSDLVLDIIGVFCPLVTIPRDINNWKENISNQIFLEKLEYILSNQDDNFDLWLKISEKFDEDSVSYNKTVRQLIYTINALNDVNMLDVYANLLRAYKLGLLSKNEFFRLTWILSNIYYDDLLYLKELHIKQNMKENNELTSLFEFKLVNKRQINGLNSNVENSYSINEIGMKMLTCGIDFENYEKYKEKLVKQ